MLNVTKTFLPKLSEYTQYLEKVWESGWVTNNGPLLKELEGKIQEKLKANHVYFCTNGTVVLQLALKALNIHKEVITTPYSYVATTNAILWENCKPVFVDVNEYDLNINTDLIEAAITENTEAILATHVYGNPCDNAALERLAAKHNLKLIYDGAHAFGTTINNVSILNWGNITTCSLHATKLFHSGEGGLLITKSDEVAHTLMLQRQFGHVYDEYFIPGINAKNSEFHAAMGLAVFPYLEAIIEHRRISSELYDNKLNLDKIQRPYSRQAIQYNYAYYPILLKDEETCLKVKSALQQENIFARRYFYPSLNTLPYLKQSNACPVSESAASRALSLPLSHDISETEINTVCKIINEHC